MADNTVDKTPDKTPATVPSQVVLDLATLKAILQPQLVAHNNFVDMSKYETVEGGRYFKDGFWVNADGKVLDEKPKEDKETK